MGWVVICVKLINAKSTWLNVTIVQPWLKMFWYFYTWCIIIWFYKKCTSILNQSIKVQTTHKAGELSLSLHFYCITGILYIVGIQNENYQGNLFSESYSASTSCWIPFLFFKLDINFQSHEKPVTKSVRWMYNRERNEVTS